MNEMNSSSRVSCLFWKYERHISWPRSLLFSWVNPMIFTADYVRVLDLLSPFMAKHQRSKVHIKFARRLYRLVL